MALLILLNNFMHDFSAAGWLFCTVLLWSILRKGIPQSDAAGTVLADTLKSILFLMKISLAGIIGFGIVRAVAYKQYEWNAAAGQSQITLLVVKHIILTGLFAMGLSYYLKAYKFIKNRCHENAK